MTLPVGCLHVLQGGRIGLAEAVHVDVCPDLCAKFPCSHFWAMSLGCLRVSLLGGGRIGLAEAVHVDVCPDLYVH